MPARLQSGACHCHALSHCKAATAQIFSHISLFSFRSLLMRLRTVLADPEPMLARLVRGCIALAFTACVPADQSSHRHADTVKGGELSYMALALQREPTAYRSLLMVAGAVLANPEPMLARLVRGCIALAFTACVRAR